MDNYKEFSYKENIRKRTSVSYIKNNECSACGFKGHTEWHHYEYKVNTVIELCSMYHRNDKR